jgi:predicted nucleotidyltransferase
MLAVEAQLGSAFAAFPELAYAAIFGSWARRDLHAGSDLDLLCIIDLPVESPAYDETLDRLHALARQFEPTLGPLVHQIHVVDHALAHWQTTSCGKQTEFTVHLYAMPRIELVSRFETAVPPTALPLLQASAAEFLAHEQMMRRVHRPAS